jgi:aryl-alcohol dehydrogenase-like predicted oxidoreductase
MVPAIGFGAWPIGGGMGAVDEADAIRTIHAAIDSGITLLDTAQAYRASEEILGRALVGRPRESVFLATKVSSPYSRGHVRQAMENSLRALRTEYVDLYQVHWWNPAYPIGETMEAMESLRQEGKTRYLGVSNFSVPQMEEALRVARFHSLQPRYNLLDRSIEHEILPFCEREGIGILAHSPLAKGMLTGKYGPGHAFAEDDERSRMSEFGEARLRAVWPKVDRLRDLARSKSKSLVQLAVNALLWRSAVTCVLVGAKTPAQVREHVGAQGWRLTDEDRRSLEAILAA